jgi:hypothetical protein
MTARHEARYADDVYRTTSTGARVPLRLGERVRAWGCIGVVTAIDWSVATRTRIVTVQSTQRGGLRVPEADVERA